MTHLFPDHSLVYKVKDSDLYAVVGEIYQRDIRQYAAEYQCLSAVPADRVVKAILFKRLNERAYEQQGQELPIQINRLEFNADDFKLSA